MEVRIPCYRENKRWQQCQIIYLRAKENGVKVSLSTLMNAILRPEDIVNINKRILQRKGGMFATKESQEAFMKGYFGRGVILIAISLIKRYWWLVLRTNCERIQRGRLRRNSFTDAMEDPSWTDKTLELRNNNFNVICIWWIIKSSLWARNW